MDETLTSPTCNGSGISISIVIPAYNAEIELRECLSSINQDLGIPLEVIVVNDGSTDQTPLIAESFGARVFTKKVKSGPASCRNWGVFEARGTWIFFLDADVSLHPQTLVKAIRHIQNHPEVDAFFGSYDDSPADPGIVSQFRNLLHHHVHQSGIFEGDLRVASTFWTGCGLIRRSVFLDLGGFDYWRYKKPAIEDIEFGYRLTQSDRKIMIARDILCKHWKRWTIRSMVRTDFFQRGLPWSLLMLRSPQKSNDLNVDKKQKIAALSTAVNLLGLLMTAFQPTFGLLLQIAMQITILVINANFFRLLARCGGLKLFLSGLILMQIYYVVCLTSYASALVIWITSDRMKLRKNGESPFTRVPANHLGQASVEVAERYHTEKSSNHSS